MKQIKYSYCLDENKNLVHISSVTDENRHSRTFFCLECGQPMIAKIGKVKVPHFAHAADTACDGESYLHKLATLAARPQVACNPRDARSTPTSTPTSTPASTEIISELVRLIGHGELSVKQMIDYRGLKDRKNFMDYHLIPAIKEGLVEMKYPDSPRHPRQKYLLTSKGLALYVELKK